VNRWLLIALWAPSFILAQAPRDIYTVDFENDGFLSSATLKYGAAFTQNPADAIQGKRSLTIDTTTNNVAWNEFFTTKPGLFKPNTPYRITFDYRWTPGKSDESSVYVLLRSKTPGRKDIGFYSKMPQFTGNTGKIQRIMRVGDDDQYSLIIGVSKKGSISIDQLVVRENETNIERPAKAAAVEVVPGPPAGKKWVPIPELSDEFEGVGLDSSKWTPFSSFWKGRAPAFFYSNNVAVTNGQLVLSIRRENYAANPDLMKLPTNFNTFTSATVQSKSTVRYGFFEVRAQPVRATCSSAFWFTRNGCEIDVFELGGYAEGHESTMYSTLHVFPADWNQKMPHWSKQTVWEYDGRLADDYHLYALDWNTNWITFFLDGQPVGKLTNTHWHQQINMLFDIETMPNWFGVPLPSETLPGTFNVDYVRSWKLGE